MNDFKFAYHIMFHPFDGFWDMKYEKKGKNTLKNTLNIEKEIKLPQQTFVT